MQYLGTKAGPNDIAVQAVLPGPQAVILADVTGGVNSTADVPFATLTIPAGFSVLAGMTWIAEAFGHFTKSNGAMNLQFWVKINGTKVAVTTHAQGNGAQTQTPLHARAGITLRSLGAAGVIGVSLHSTHLEAATVEMGGASGTITVDTGAAITIAIGANLSVANAGYSVTATYARVGQ